MGQEEVRRFPRDEIVSLVSYFCGKGGGLAIQADFPALLRPCCLVS